MPAIGFDNQKYLTTQSEQIKGSQILLSIKIELTLCRGSSVTFLMEQKGMLSVCEMTGHRSQQRPFRNMEDMSFFTHARIF